MASINSQSGPRARARASYERGRLQTALIEAFWLAPLVAFALLRCKHVTPTCIGSLVLVAATIGFRFRGGIWGRSVVPAVMAALPALLIPALLPPSATGCATGQLFPACMLLCPLTGVFAGLTLGAWSAQQGADWGRAMLAGAAMMVACGSLGCGVFGVAGVAGLLLGAAVSAPVALSVMAREPQ